MKRRITLSIALALVVVLVSLMSSDQVANAEPPQRFVFDTGIVKVGDGQTLILSVVAGDFNGDGHLDVGDFVFKRFVYMQGPCSGDGVCRQTIDSQSTSDPIMLMAGEAASIAVDPSDPNVIYVRAAVVSNSRDVRVNAMIIDNATGEVSAFFGPNVNTI